MSDKKTFPQWLEEFRTQITIAYKQTTMAPALSEYVHEDCKDISKMLFRVELQPRTTGSENVHMVDVKMTPRDAKPLNAGFSQELGDWSAHPEEICMDMVMHELGKNIAENEYAIIVKGIENYAEIRVKAKQKGQLCVDDIMNASARAQEYPDSVIMSIQQMRELLINGKISTTSGFLPNEKRGPHYYGAIGALNVFYSNFIVGFALVFSRREMNFASTPLEIVFDNIEAPQKLITRKMCVAAPSFDKAVVKIELS